MRVGRTILTMNSLFESHLSLPLYRRGKVRDVYAVDDEHLLIVATDRLSAFDVVLPTPIPGKGQILNAISNFWFARTRSRVPNHLALIPIEAVILDPAERALVQDRAVVVRRAEPLPIEAIVRGFLIGSGFKDYQHTGRLCGIALPAHLPLAARLPEPIFTPSTKANTGEHDLNIGFDEMTKLIGTALADRVRTISLALYQEAWAYAQARDILIADTKFEFGLDTHGNLMLIDELLTPDSSRFWPADSYRPGINPPSFDKQFVRDYLEGLNWNKRPPAPLLPETIVQQTAARYTEAKRRLMDPVD